MPHRVPKPQAFWPLNLIILIALLGLNAVQSYQALEELVNNESRASTTKSVLRTIKDLYSSVQDAELGIRAYLLSGDEAYLAPYESSLTSIALYHDQLNSFDYELLDQRERVDNLKSMIDLRLNEMLVLINLKKNNPNSEQIPARLMMQSHQRIEGLRSLIIEMENFEYQLLSQQSSTAKNSREDLRFTIIVANSVGLILILITGYLVWNALRRHRQEAEQLEAIVRHRTQELEHYSNELQRSNRELQDFAFVASHDLQEPLRKIRAFGDRLKTLYAGKLGDGEDYVNRMQNAALRMSKLIEDLLEFSRVSTRTRPFEPVDLNQTLADVVDLLEVAIEESNATINSDLLPVINADPSQMQQLFLNLMSNSLKFKRENTAPVISLRCTQVTENDNEFVMGNERYIITLSDNGIGFEQQYAEKIFTPFQRLHGRDKYSGTGIGLAICRRIIERHHGFLEVESIPGEGTTFTMSFIKKISEPKMGNPNSLIQHSE